MAPIDHKQKSLSSLEEIREGVYNLEQEMFQITTTLERFKSVLETAKTGQEVFDAYKPFVEGWLSYMNQMNAVDKLTKTYGKTIDPYLKQLDGEN